MREGELVALRWESDIDFTGKRIKVSGTLKRIKGKGLVRTEPKTQASKAPIPLPDQALKLFRWSQHSQQRKLRKDAGDLWQESGYVFTLSNGGAIDGRHVLHKWRKIQEDLGLPDMTVHELRHTTGTLLLSAGVRLEVVSAILRHTGVEARRTFTRRSRSRSQAHRNGLFRASARKVTSPGKLMLAWRGMALLPSWIRHASSGVRSKLRARVE